MCPGAPKILANRRTDPFSKSFVRKVVLISRELYKLESFWANPLTMLKYRNQKKPRSETCARRKA